MQLFYLLGVDIDVPVWLLVILGILYAYYKYMTWHFGIFKKLGIPGPKPTPVLGNLRALFKLGIRKWDIQNVKEYGHLIGTFNGRSPLLTVSDVSFIKQVLVKDFNNFIDRSSVEFDSKPLNRALTSLRGEEWRVVRNTLTPTFSGGKMKKMNHKINACVKQFVENIGEKVDKDESFDLLVYAGNYTMDVIASTAFGLQVNSQKEPNNPFIEHAKASQIQSMKSPLVMVMFFFPFALRFLTRIGLVPVFPKKSNNFFSSIAEQTLQARKENTGKKDQDFMQLMADAHKEATEDDPVDSEDNMEGSRQDKGKKTTLTKDDILGNTLLFFLAGYETTANTIAFMGYYLATNPDCQDTLCEEIDRVVGDKVPDYNILNSLPYLEKFMCETLRLQPQAVQLTRLCMNDTTINGVFVPKDMLIIVPVLSLHMNPDVWPEPEKFDPERFSAEEKASRDPYNYQPFGLGPRACIGMRLALMEMKIALISLLQNFKFVTCPETEIPMKMHAFLPKPVNGMMLKAERRQANAEA